MQARRVGDEIHLLHRGNELAVIDLDDAYDLHQCLSEVLEFDDIDELEDSLDEDELALADEDELAEFIDRELQELEESGSILDDDDLPDDDCDSGSDIGMDDEVSDSDFDETE